MMETVATIDTTQIPHLVHRIQQLEEQIQLINMRLQVQYTVPRFEFVIEINDKPVWTGSDLQTEFPKIFQQYPNEEITISWRSSPVVWI